VLVFQVRTTTERNCQHNDEGQSISFSHDGVPIVSMIVLGHAGL
jgi:hypothetical protein